MAQFACALCGIELGSEPKACDPAACAMRQNVVLSATVERQAAELVSLRARVALPGNFVMAQPIKADSWLHDDRHTGAAEFRRFYSYLKNKTHAIPACAACSPEDLFHVVGFLDHWRERVREGLE